MLADTFQALADPTRLRILALLGRMELSVGELAQVLGQSQPRVSRHVKILADAGLAERRREGSWVFLAPMTGPRADALARLVDMLAGEADCAQADADARLLAAVRADRAEAAAGWFAAQAAAWDGIRSLHVAESEVEAAVARALGSAGIGKLVDIGTGTGRMLELFAPAATAAVGFDKSSEMLRVARAKLDDLAARVELRQGDMYALPLPSGDADLVILHQVLHYADEPAAAIREAARVLAPGGRLVVIDFAPHELEELRARDQHRRLGFGDAAVLDWMRAGGLDGEVLEHLAGGALTVTLWRGIKPAVPLRRVA